jgi:adenylate kinase family enzyme
VNNQNIVIPRLPETHFSRERFLATSFVHLVAPTCAGKGHLMKRIKLDLLLEIELGHLRAGFVSFGDIVKNLLETNPDFNVRYGESMKAGDLLPDDEVISIFEREIDKVALGGMTNINFIDGFCRSPQQIAFAADNGYLVAGDQVFIIKVDEDVCLERFMHRCKNQPARIDAELPTFHRRFRDYHKTLPELRGMFMESGCRVIEVDGNPDIAADVFPVIQKAVHKNLLEACRSVHYEPLTMAA